MKEEKQNKNNHRKENINIKKNYNSMEIDDLNQDEIEFEIIDDIGYDIEQFLCRCSSKTTDHIC